MLSTAKYISLDILKIGLASFTAASALPFETSTGGSNVLKPKFVVEKLVFV